MDGPSSLAMNLANFGYEDSDDGISDEVWDKWIEEEKKKDVYENIKKRERLYAENNSSLNTKLENMKMQIESMQKQYLSEYQKNRKKLDDLNAYMDEVENAINDSTDLIKYQMQYGDSGYQPFSGSSGTMAQKRKRIKKKSLKKSTKKKTMKA
jgi:hypothetical protein